MRPRLKRSIVQIEAPDGDLILMRTTGGDVRVGKPDGSERALLAALDGTHGLVELEESHAFANIALTDNVVRFATRRYCDNPLIVQGPGAGPEVTAGGIFGDLLRLCAYLGAKV